MSRRWTFRHFEEWTLREVSPPLLLSHTDTALTEMYSAETTAGGFALWTIDGSYGALRNNDPRYTAAWEPFMSASNEISGKHQFAVGGSVVSNAVLE